MNDIDALHCGIEAAFEDIYERYHEKLYLFILKKTSSTYLAEEVVQITFIKLWDNRRKLSNNFSIEVQLFQIAKTTLIDILRKNASRKKVTEYYNDIVMQESDIVTNTLLEKEMSARIIDVVEKMPPIRKQVFKMSRESGLSHKEIGEKLSLTPKNIENHITKAIKQIKKVLLFQFIFF